MAGSIAGGIVLCYVYSAQETVLCEMAYLLLYRKEQNTNVRVRGFHEGEM
jgi:hypothetical protein